MRCRSLAAFMVAALVVGGFAACGSDESSESLPPFQRIRAASGKTLDAGSAKMAISVKTEGSTNNLFEGEGTFDFAKRAGTMTMDTSQFAATGLPKELKMVLDGQLIYMNLGGILPGGKPWAKIDLTKVDELGEEFEALSQLGASNDPRSALAYIEGVSDDVTTVGPEEVRGTATTHYKATMDLEKAEANVKGDDLKRAIRTLIDQAGTSTMPAEFWLDREGRIRRSRSTLDLSKVKGAAGQTGTSTTTIEFFEFGIDVKIAIPPADETTDFADLLKAGSGG